MEFSILKQLIDGSVSSGVIIVVLYIFLKGELKVFQIKLSSIMEDLTRIEEVHRHYEDSRSAIDKEIFTRVGELEDAVAYLNGCIRNDKGVGARNA